MITPYGYRSGILRSVASGKVFNVRSGPDICFNAVSSISQEGESVYYKTDVFKGDIWYLIILQNGYHGYIKSQQGLSLTMMHNREVYLDEIDCFIKNTSSDRWNVRMQPDIASEIVTVLNPGNQYQVIGHYRNWYLVSTGNRLGWISGTLSAPIGSGCSNIPEISPEKPYPVIKSTRTSQFIDNPDVLPELTDDDFSRIDSQKQVAVIQMSGGTNYYVYSDMDTSKTDVSEASDSGVANIGTIYLDEVECYFRNNGTDRWNIRLTPSLSGDIVGVMKPGDRYPIIGQHNGWYLIKTDKRMGWISSTLGSPTGDKCQSNSINYVSPDDLPSVQAVRPVIDQASGAEDSENRVVVKIPLPEMALNRAEQETLASLFEWLANIIRSMPEYAEIAIEGDEVVVKQRIADSIQALQVWTKHAEDRILK